MKINKSTPIKERSHPERYFEIDGYWKDDKSEFYNLIVTDFNSFNVYNVFDLLDDDIFYFGMSENNLIEAIESGEDTIEDFVITNYREML